MKKICFFLILLVTLAGVSFAADTASSSPAAATPALASQPAADTVRFDNERTILLVRTTQSGYPVRFMEQRLRQPFRLPYWDRLSATETISPEDITEDMFNGFLDTHDIPDPDLLIRTSGELRLSNYLLWQLAYTEFYFTDVLWPDFNKEELKKAIAKYNERDRRFGKVEEN